MKRSGTPAIVVVYNLGQSWAKYVLHLVQFMITSYFVSSFEMYGYIEFFDCHVAVGSSLTGSCGLSRLSF